jgi:hypothetical protein
MLCRSRRGPGVLDATFEILSSSGSRWLFSSLAKSHETGFLMLYQSQIDGWEIEIRADQQLVVYCSGYR